MTDQLSGKVRTIKCNACVKEGVENPNIPANMIEQHVKDRHWYT